MRRRSATATGTVLAVLLLGLPTAAGAAANPPGTPPGVPGGTLQQRLAQDTTGAVVVQRDVTGQPRLIGTQAGHPFRRPTGVAASAGPAGVAQAFLARYGALFGVADPAGQLRVQRTASGTAGPTVVRMQQTAAGLPVLGGDLAVSLDRSGDVLSVNGRTSRAGLAGPATVAAATARATAIAATAAARGVPAARLVAGTAQLWAYDPTLLGVPGASSALRPVWRFEVTAGGGRQVRDLVLVDARSGRVSLHVNEIARALNRVVCDQNNVRSAPPPSVGWPDYRCSPTFAVAGPTFAGYARTEGAPPAGPPYGADVNTAYDNTGKVAAFYQDTLKVDLTNLIGDAPDSPGGPKVLRSTVDYCPPYDPTHPSWSACPYDNAFWDGTQMVYGTGTPQALDVVGHELTHGVTQNTSQLVYAYQAGAIDESLSDTFGQLVDRANGDTTWLIGQNLPTGPVRNMADPPQYGQPDAMTSPRFTADPSFADNGGVHTNSGVGNKAAYLIAQGGTVTFNGIAVTGLGIPKAAAIYWQVEQLLPSGADYADLAAALMQGCTNLVAAALYGITTADCGQVDHAVQATQMQQPAATPGAGPARAPVCATGGPNAALFSADFEDAQHTAANWSFGAGWTWLDPNAGGATSSPPGSQGSYAKSGHGSLLGATSATGGPYLSAITLNRPISVPAAGRSYLRFTHVDMFRTTSAGAAADGGRVQASVDGGTNWFDLGPRFADTGYDATASRGGPTGTPMFGGDSPGFAASRVDLTTLAGRSVLLRFLLDADGAGQSYWVLDTVSIYGCSAAVPRIGIDARPGLAGGTLLARRPADGAVLQYRFTGRPVEAATSVGGGQTWSAPAAVTGPAGNPGTPQYGAVAVRGLDNGVWLTSGWPGSPVGWNALGGMTYWSPAVAYDAANHLHVLVTGTDHQLWENVWAGGWSGWHPLGGYLLSGPSAATVGGQIMLAATGGDRAVWQRVFGAGWGGWWSVGGQTYQGPGIGYDPASGTSVLGVRGTDGALWVRVNGGGWYALGGGLLDGPAVGTVPDQLTVAVEGTDGRIWSRTLSGTGSGAGWSAWQPD